MIDTVPRGYDGDVPELIGLARRAASMFKIAATCRETLTLTKEELRDEALLLYALADELDRLRRLSSTTDLLADPRAGGTS